MDLSDRLELVPGRNKNRWRRIRALAARSVAPGEGAQRRTWPRAAPRATDGQGRGPNARSASAAVSPRAR
jgi:hypothetical protein